MHRYLLYSTVSQQATFHASAFRNFPKVHFGLYYHHLFANEMTLYVQRSSNTALNCNILNWQRNFLTARWPRGHTFDLNSSTWLHACTKEDKRVANNQNLYPYAVLVGLFVQIFSSFALFPAKYVCLKRGNQKQSQG